MKERIISIVLASAIFINLVGCAKNNKQIENNDSKLVTEITEVEENLDEQALINLQSYLAKIAGIEVSYNYPEYYFTETDYQEYLKIVASKADCQNTELKEPSFISNAILSNSNINGDNERGKNIIYSLILAIIKINNDSRFTEEDICKLKDISIETDILDSGIAAYFDEDKTIVIDYEKIKAEYEELDTQVTFKDYLCEIIQHELNHVRQFICDCRKNAGQINKTVSYLNNEDYPSFIIEGSAESQVYNKEVNGYTLTDKDTFDFNYYFERGYQSTLLLMGLFKDDFSIDKYYAAINNSDLEALYEMFGVDTKEDFISFYNIIYAMDTLNARTTLCGDLYDLGYTTLGEMEDQVGSSYKVDLFKFVIKDLLNKITKDELSLNESLILYNYVKANILHFTYDVEYINGEYTYLYDEKLINGIGDIDDIFYEFIRDYFKVSQEDINEKLSSYEISASVYHLGYYSVLEYEKRYKVNELIIKYPLITEISFCNSVSYHEVEIFDQAKLNNSIKDR